MPDIASAIDASMGTVERRLSRNPATRKSFVGFELQMLALYFSVPVECFYTGMVDLQSSRLGEEEVSRRRYEVPAPRTANQFCRSTDLIAA